MFSSDFRRLSCCNELRDLVTARRDDEASTHRRTPLNPPIEPPRRTLNPAISATTVLSRPVVEWHERRLTSKVRSGNLAPESRRACHIEAASFCSSLSRGRSNVMSLMSRWTARAISKNIFLARQCEFGSDCILMPLKSLSSRAAVKTYIISPSRIEWMMVKSLHSMTLRNLL
jgi:hypothetical protein